MNRSFSFYIDDKLLLFTLKSWFIDSMIICTEGLFPFLYLIVGNKRGFCLHSFPFAMYSKIMNMINEEKLLTGIARLVHVFDLDLATQILISPC